MQALLIALAALSQSPQFERVVVDSKLPGGYQVEVADVNGDGKPDIVGLGGGTCAWYENPTWRKHLVTTGTQTPGIISTATSDIDGDGRAEIAIGYEFAMAEPTKGKLLLAVQNDKSGDAWTLKHVADFGSIHRLRWADIDGDRKRELIVSPIFGPRAKGPDFDQDPAVVRYYQVDHALTPDQWRSGIVDQRPVLHAIDAIDLDGDGRSEVLTACIDGVVAHTYNPETRLFSPSVLSPGKPGEGAKRGSSEVHVGRLKDGSRFVASVDAWHGGEVAVYGPVLAKPGTPAPTPTRTVIDATLDDGHALWVADVDGDGDDEVFAGHRGKDYRVSMYDFDGKTWNRTVIDREVAAQDLRGGDLDGDGRPDVVAIGGKTANVILYRSKKP